METKKKKAILVYSFDPSTQESDLAIFQSSSPYGHLWWIKQNHPTVMLFDFTGATKDQILRILNEKELPTIPEKELDEALVALSNISSER